MPTIWTGQCWGVARTRQGGRKGVPYCITLRSRTDARITGWYAGRSCLWSTDHKRQKRFDDPHDASTVCHELRSLCPRNAKVINIEVAQEELNRREAKMTEGGADTADPARSRWPCGRA